MTTDLLQALLQHMRENSQDMGDIRKAISDLQMTTALEQSATHQRFSNIIRELDAIKAKQAMPAEFTFTHLRRVPLLQAALAIGMTLGALKLPDQSAAFVISVAKLLIGM